MIDLASSAKRSGIKLILIMGLALAALGVSYSRVLDNYELELLDARFLLRGGQPASDDIVLIEIGDDTIAKLEAWPIDRRYYAMIIKALSGAGARAVLFDIIFTDATPNEGELEGAIK